jgi:hypothetical protein
VTDPDPLDSELDRLFQLPPAELIPARNALADQLKRAGDKAGAARVKAIKRASPVAWALNQVHFEHPELLEDARERANELRELQAQRGVDARRLGAAVEQHRTAMQAVVEAALRAGRNAGLSETALQSRKLLTTVQAWLAGKGEEAPGRMTQEIEASGFDAFAGMTLSQAPALAAAVAASASKPSEVAASDAQAAKRAVDREAIDRAAKLLAEREQAAVMARERARARSIEQATARQVRDSALANVREAERRAAELRTVLDQRELALQQCAAAVEQAQREQARADEALAAARSELTGQDERLR